ncbi:DUF7576 family protein [Halosimplex sp. J119]
MASAADRETFDVCGHCGDRLAGPEWYPATTRVGTDGEVLVVSFCDDGCLAAWEAAR